MKGKKLLAAVLSLVMILGTMAMPAFAAEESVSTQADFLSKLGDTTTDVIKLTSDIELTVAYPGAIGVNKSCTIDLNGYNLDMTNASSFQIYGKNVTFKSDEDNAKIIFASTTDAAIVAYNGCETLDVKNITFEQTTGESYAIIQTTQAALTIDGCTMTNVRPYFAGIVGNHGSRPDVTVKNSQIKTEKRALFGGNITVTDSTITGEPAIKVAYGENIVLTGNTTIDGAFDVQHDNGPIGNILTVGSDVTITDESAAAQAKKAVMVIDGDDEDNITYWASLADAMKNAQEGDTIKLNGDAEIGQTNFKNSIDLNGNTLYLTAGSNYIQKDITISNGTIAVGQVKTTADCVINLYSHDAAVGAVFDNVNITTGKNFEAACGLLGVYHENKLTYNGGSITIGNNDGNGVDAVFNGGLGSCKGQFDIKNVTVTVIEGEEVEKVINCSPNAVVEGLTFTGAVKKDTFSNVAGTVKNSAFTYTNTGSMRTIVNDATHKNMLSFENVEFKGVPECTDGVFKLEGVGSVVKGDKDTKIDTEAKAFETKLGDTYYSTLEEALKAAQTGETVTLVADTTYAINGLDKSIDLGGHTLTLKDGTGYVKNVVISNGTVIANDLNNNQQGIISAYEGVFELRGVKFYCDNLHKTNTPYIFNAEYGYDFMVTNGSEIYITNYDYSGASEQEGYVFAANGSSCTVIDGSEVHVDGATGAFLQNTKIKDSKIDVKNVESGFKATTNDLTIENSEVTIDGCEIGFDIRDGISLTINGSANKKTNVTVKNASVAGIKLSGDATYSKNDDANVIASVYTVADSESVAEKLNVKVVEVSGKKGEYNIVIEGADDKNINEFVNAELKISTTAAGYEVVESNNDITIVENKAVGKENVYMFRWNKAERKAEKEIVLGTIVIPQAGSFTVGIDKTYANEVIATKYNTTDEAYFKGDTLTIADAIDTNVAEDVRSIRVNISFVHDIFKDVSDDYKYMTVTLKDSLGKKYEPVTVTIDDKNNGHADFKDIPVGYVTVTLEAKGYRKFTYQTNMKSGKDENDALVLSFWNSVELNAKSVEEGGAAMAHNFLAGDIAMDYIIDEYDLAAVTSYYGTYDIGSMSAKDQEKLVKYDLNRDGQIDITDVAYVLHSLNH